MLSDKPQILCRTTYEIKTKLEKIAKKDKRSVSNLVEKIIEDYLNEYEKENGTVNIEFNGNSVNNGDFNIGKQDNK